LASDLKTILAFEEIGFELGLFFWSRKAVHFHNPFVKKRLRSFWAFGEIGFVYSDYKIIFFSVILCYTRACVHLGFSEIGFDWV